MKIYEKTLEIPFYDCDYKAEITGSSILKYLGEVSVTHNDLTVSEEEMRQRNLGWMLNKWKVEINRFPKALEKIKIKTWISRVEMFFANREFSILDEVGEEIVRATALWIFLDLNKRKPMRLTDEFVDRNKIVDKFNFRKFSRFDRKMDFENELEIRVRKGDIDTNKHVNNVNYFTWMLETVPNEIYMNYKLKNFEIDYKQEVSYPSYVVGVNNITKENDQISILHGIYQDDFNKDNALGLSQWEKI